MLGHLRRRATTRSAATPSPFGWFPSERVPTSPEGYDGMGASSSFPLLEDGMASMSSRRLEYAPMALVTGGTGGFRPGL